MLSQEILFVAEKSVLEYVKKTEVNYQSQTASESTYYEGLIKFLENIFPLSKGYLIQSGYKIKESKNKPDITVSYNGVILFHIEAKLPNTPIENLVNFDSNDRLKDQISRYQSDGTQLLLTDFFNVWLVKSQSQEEKKSNPEFAFKCTLIEQNAKGLNPAQNASANLQRLLTITCEDYIQTISNVKSLIPSLAGIAQGLREIALKLLAQNNRKILNSSEIIASDYLQNIKTDFKNSIFKEEAENEDELFADLFAQTIIYGAFSAWIRFNQQRKKQIDFTIQIIGDYLPFGSFIRDLFLNLRNKIPQEFQAIFNELQAKFQKTEYYRVMNNTESLITTFYSDFLHAYDPKTAKDRGVVYTPHEIVEFMVQGIDFALARWLEKPDGIISISNTEKNISKGQKQIQTKLDEKPVHKNIDNLRILDPAAGTMAFSCGLLHVAKNKFFEKYGQNSALALSAFDNWVRHEFFQNMYAFEILMAPYVLGHIRTFLTLEELGLSLNSDDFKLKSYLMNTLMTPPVQTSIEDWVFNYQEIGKEIKEALTIRDRRDIFVIMGNPPYNLSSQNNCDWINKKLLVYKDGLKEKNQKILADDYVKFIRFAQWKVEQVGTGIVAYITNNHYLDGQMFSVMRKSLSSTFDHIYIVNLHGDMRKTESGNPFDIRVGVAIAIMVRIDNSPNKKAAIHYMDVPHATKEEKLGVLMQGFNENQFKLLSPTTENYFVEMDTSELIHYETFAPLDSFFFSDPTSGIMIGREKLLVDVDKKILETNLNRFFAKNFADLDQLGIKTADTKTWDREEAIRNTTLKDASNSIRIINYRGFDFRYIAYNRTLVEGHRMGYIDQISDDNPAITVTKSSRKKRFDTGFIVTNLIEKCYMSVTDTAYAYPLKLNGKSNIKLPSLPYKVDSEEIFYYIYGILYSPTYRQKYDEYLRKSIPRIPLPKNGQFLHKMSDYGKQLAKIHLLKDIPITQFELSDTKPDGWKIENYSYDAKNHTLYFKQGKILTESIWIKGITPKMWEFTIGTIPQLEQFLESRELSSHQKWNTLMRPLDHFELNYFLKMAGAIKLTLDLLPKLDEMYRSIDNSTD